MVGSCELEGADAVRGGVADIVATVAILGIEIRLEWKDAKNLIAVFRNGMNTPLFPRPNLRWNVIYHFGMRQMFLAELSHLEIERWIVDEDKHIWTLLQQSLFGNAKIAFDFI